jgi:hypothetical protein
MRTLTDHDVIEPPLAKRFGVEAGDLVIFDSEADLDWFAADFAVFHVGLAVD